MSNHRINTLYALDQTQTEQLSQLLALPFAKYRQVSSPFITDFIRHLRTLAGLSLTACLVDDFWYPAFPQLITLAWVLWAHTWHMCASRCQGATFPYSLKRISGI